MNAVNANRRECENRRLILCAISNPAPGSEFRRFFFSGFRVPGSGFRRWALTGYRLRATDN